MGERLAWQPSTPTGLGLMTGRGAEGLSSMPGSPEVRAPSRPEDLCAGAQPQLQSPWELASGLCCLTGYPALLISLLDALTESFHCELTFLGGKWLNPRKKMGGKVKL